MKRTLLLAALFLLTGCSSSSDSPPADSPPESLSSAAPELSTFVDPDAEERVHGDVGIEWWFFWGFLTDTDGEEWGIFTSFFRMQPKEGKLARYLWYDLTNLRTGERSYRSAVGKEAWNETGEPAPDVRLPSPHEFIGSVLRENPGDPSSLDYGKDRLEIIGKREYLLSAEETSFHLRAITEPMTAEGTEFVGLSRHDDMQYYTFPRLEGQGTVRGKEATGMFWYDHQWGDSWMEPDVGWSWWALQLDDGTNAVAYVLRNTDTGEILRSIVKYGNDVLPLSAEPLSYWESSRGVRYPVTWRLSFGDHELTITPYQESRELEILGGPQEIWSGLVRVSGTATGKGFQELFGYLQEMHSMR